MDVWHYGLITLSPITEPLMYILKVVGLTTEKIPSYYLNYYVQDFVDIGAKETVMFNNNTTTLLPFLLDGGIIGILFGAIILAYLSIKTYIKFVNNKIIGSLFYLYVVNGLFMTTISYQVFMGLGPIIMITVSYVCFKPILKK